MEGPKPKFSRGTEKAIGSLGLAILIAIGGFYFGAKPLAEKIKLKNFDIAVKEEEYNLKKQKVDNLKEFSSILSSQKAKIDTISQALPSEEDIPEILTSINAMAASSGLRLVSFTPAAGQGETTAATNTKGGSLSILPISLTLSGTWGQVDSFLKNVESNIRPIQLKSISLGAGQAGPDPVLAVSIELETYYQK